MPILEDKLTISQLIQLHKNLQLGDDHVRRVFNTKELNKLLSSSTLKEGLKQKINVDLTESIGKIMLVINPVITGAFGSWLGISGFMNLSLAHPAVFIFLLCFSLLVSGVLGFISVYTMKKDSDRLFNEIKESNFEILILDLIERKKSEEIEKNFHFIKEKTTTLLKPENKVTIHSGLPVEHWLRPFNEITLKLINNKDQLKHPILRKMVRSGHFSAQEKASQRLALFIKNLSAPAAKKMNKNPSWILANLDQLCVSAIPTLIGSFGSMFVYFSGMPNISKNLGHSGLVSFFSNPKMQSMGITVACLITLYFFFSFLYVSMKSFNRSKPLELNKKKIIEKEAFLTELDNKLNQSREAKRYVAEVTNLIEILTQPQPVPQ